MELRHLRYFIAVCDTLHFGRAAELMHIAQPALSQQIKNLESEIGVDLFSRTKRNVELTPAGEIFAKRARLILGNVNSAVQETRNNGLSGRTYLRVGTLSSIQLFQLIPLLKEFRINHPEVSISVVQMPTHLQLAALTAGAIDVGFMDSTSTNLLSTNIGIPISSIDVLQEELVAALPFDHPLATRQAIALAELAGSAFLLTDRTSECSLGARIYSLCDVAGFRPELYSEALDLPSAIALVAAGYGVTLAPACAIRQWQHCIRFVPVDIRPSISVAMVWRSDDSAASLDAFCKAVVAIPTAVWSAFA